MQNKHKQGGATLIELIISIVIVTTSLAGVLGLINFTVIHSADPIVQQQAIAIAEAYIEEITALPIEDPDSTNTGETRATFDDIDDYNGLSDNGVQDQSGNAIAALANYTVDVNINRQAINGINDVRVITVNVSRPSTQTISLTAYRAPY